MQDTWIAVAAALPWLIIAIVAYVRGRDMRGLDAESPVPSDPTPFVSVIVPARNEAHNIVRCVRSILTSTYPAFEIIVVNDHSTDDTGALVRAIAMDDPRVQLIDNPDLPSGWFGKQWACHTGAMAAKGDILFFTDADTTHAPDLMTRSVNGMQRSDADLFTVLGWQELGSFWERLLQPQIFSMMATRYGGTEHVNRSRRIEDKIANGQCIFVRRSTYEALGGHALVRDNVAEDLMLAQRWFAAGKRVVLINGLDQLSTRMYTSLPELIRGWRKNLFAGGRYTVPGGRVGRFIYPLLLVTPGLVGLIPPVLLLLAAGGVISGALTLWAALTTGLMLVWWLSVYYAMRVPIRYALLFPLGAAVLLYITGGAILRGNRVEWKGRQYRST